MMEEMEKLKEEFVKFDRNHPNLAVEVNKALNNVRVLTSKINSNDYSS
jgi:hypothetical protein